MLEVVQRSAAYWRVVIRHPPLNLLDRALLDELRALMDRMESAPELTVVVFESGLADYFMAHQDFTVRPAEASQAARPAFPFADLTKRLELAPFVSIGLLRGRARAAGSEFLLAMDLRFASAERALLGHPEAGLGLFPGGGAVERLSALIGRARALEVMVGAEDYSGQTAERLGWVNQCMPDSELDGFVERFSCRLVRFGRQSVSLVKRLQGERSSFVPVGQLRASEARLAGLLGDPERVAHLQQFFDQGLQKDSQFERNLGSLLGLQ